MVFIYSFFSNKNHPSSPWVLVNGNSIHKKHKFCDIVALFRETNPDVVAFTEAKLPHPSSPDLLVGHKRMIASCPSGYKGIFTTRPSNINNRGAKAGHGGVAFMHRESILVKKTNMDIQASTFDHLVAQIHYQKNTICAVVLYRMTKPRDVVNQREVFREEFEHFNL